MPVGRSFTVQHVHLGPTGDVKAATFSALGGTITSGSGPWIGQLGQVFEQDGKFYRLVKFDDGTGAVATVDGGVMYWKDKANYTVTADASDAEGLANGVAGGCHVASVTDGYYFFIQCGGDQAAVIVAASTVNGDHMTGHASTDNVLTRTAAGTSPVNKLVATALTTRGTTTSDAGGSISNSSKVRWETGALI